MKFQVGDTVFVRGNTRDDYVGRIVSIDGPFTVSLEQCSWVAESGRFHQFMATGKADGMEIEYIGDWTVNWSAIKVWNHPLFAESV